MAVSGADVEKIKDEIDPRFNELSTAIENLKFAAKEQEAKEKARRRHDVILRAVQNINPEIQSGRLTNGWNWWGDSGYYSNTQLGYSSMLNDLALPVWNESQTVHAAVGGAFYTDDDEKYSVCLTKKSQSGYEMTVLYRINKDSTSNGAMEVKDFNGNPRMLFADRDLNYFAIHVDANKIRLYERQESEFTFVVQIDFPGEIIASMEGGGNIIFITTRSKKIFGIKRNGKGSFSKLTHTDLGINIEEHLVYSKCTPDGKTVVFVNKDGYTKDKEFIRIYEFNGLQYQKQTLDVSNRKYSGNPQFELQSKKLKKNLLISKNGETIILTDRSSSQSVFTVIRKKDTGYYVAPASFQNYYYFMYFNAEYRNWGEAIKMDIAISDCGRYLFVARFEHGNNVAGIRFFYYDLHQEYLKTPIREMGYVPLVSSGQSDNYQNLYYHSSSLLSLEILNGNILRTVHGGNHNANYAASLRIYVEIPWEV